jgi:hypothetical protein
LPPEHSPRRLRSVTNRMLSLASESALAAAEDVPLQQSLTPGMRVRILAPDLSPSKVIGTIEQVSDDSVTLGVPGRNEPVSILREKIARLDVSEGPRSRGVDATIGVAIPPGEHWQEVSAARYRVSFAPRLDHGAKLAVAWKSIVEQRAPSTSTIPSGSSRA